MLFPWQQFLSKYHYLSPIRGGNHSVEVAIKNFQSFTGLPVTGDLDAATIKQTRAPRCGMPDDVNSEGRVKRYSTDSKWSKKRLRYFVRYARKYGADLPKSTQAKVFRKALKYWSDVSGLSFSLKFFNQCPLTLKSGKCTPILLARSINNAYVGM